MSLPSSADLVGSTALTESLDPEDAMEVLGEAIAQIVLVVEDLGGTVKDLAGDGVLALFGAPVAHEDDVDRAVHAGLRIVEMFRGDKAGPPLDVRVGVETGLVVLGPVGAGSRVEYVATGDTVNTAARLQAFALGRTGLDRLWVDGDPDLAAAFQDYVPGP